MGITVEFYIPEKDRSSCDKKFREYFDEKISKKIEIGIYNYTKQYCKCNNIDIKMAPGIYNHTLENILFNFNTCNETITNIINNINEGNFNPLNLAFLKPNELNEEIWDKIITRKVTTEKMLTNLPTMQWKQCRDCKHNQYSYYQLQTRSVDEPMTTFYICKQCNKTYKVNN